MIDHSSTGAQARALRKAKGKTITFVAAKLKFSVPYLCDLELGRRAWNSNLLARFEKALQ